jgi:hypothetical protein
MLAVVDFSSGELWRFILPGFALTIGIETIVLLIGLSKSHSIKRRLWCGVWLTACTYPIVVLVLPLAMRGMSYTSYLIVAETFAPAVECALFALLYHDGTMAMRERLRDFGAIVVANLLSFGIGYWVFS